VAELSKDVGSQKRAYEEFTDGQWQFSQENGVGVQVVTLG